ncbi:MAG: hypothetical protein QG559_1822 [Campylobacterota bacterium]|nr:hypothetical protein [Campylobacterota bacterium]
MTLYEKQINNFIQNLKDANFYDAHEDLEAIWFERRFEDSDEVRFLKGLINASVAFELSKKTKFDASKKVWQNYLKYKNLIEVQEPSKIDKYREALECIDAIKSNFSHL